MMVALPDDCARARSVSPGDLRNCLNQLVTDPSIGSLLFEYRFAGRGELAGHNLGNLMLLALDNLCVRPLDAIKHQRHAENRVTIVTHV